MPVSRMAECATSGRIAHKVRHLTIMIDHMSQPAENVSAKERWLDGPVRNSLRIG
ncbi:hypothetical protein CpipJ_CPIJ016419 [Culex quinquefasciatus]|uniref:Uncharacterized protein n=1 Tax=Culex quinquefasciatus TaxID=7176 RepID=B0XA04_CULQU|nr:hypothetical protein CpipJ_CPIJ016419 [Culex quinquefasciatus]|eukprot:XP_001866476.1 hypothetical protein CpipJ_CPIJ016419 [Culex quinquefasciatus]